MKKQLELDENFVDSLGIPDDDGLNFDDNSLADFANFDRDNDDLDG